MSKRAERNLKLGLIGDNIAYSKAPLLHVLAGQLAGVMVTYDRLVPPDLGTSFEETFDNCAAAGYRGINVTYPYKEQAARLVSIDDPLVMAIAAVNTILFETGGPRGYNTDFSGFKAAFCHVLGDVRPGPVCLIGAGGVGKAVAFGLVALGLRDLRVVEIDQHRANQLASALNASNPDLRVSVSNHAAAAVDGADGLVNCTPIGMVGHEGTPLARDFMAGARWAFDAVYTPVNTRFLQDAAGEGLTIISGYELFFYQGVHAWRLFSGQAVDLAGLRKQLSKSLAEAA